MTAEGWVLIIGAFFAGIAGCISAWGTYYGRKEARFVAEQASEERKLASGKLDVIHDLTNSKMTALKEELAETKRQWTIALDRIGRLEVLLHAATTERDRRHDD